MNRFKLITAWCPVCGKLAEGTVETLRGLAEINVDPVTRIAEYSGTTEIWWDEQRTVFNENASHIILGCPEGHEWGSEYCEEDDG